MLETVTPSCVFTAVIWVNNVVVTLTKHSKSLYLFYSPCLYLRCGTYYRQLYSRCRLLYFLSSDIHIILRKRL